MDLIKVDTKLLIFNTALRLFAEKGYENVSIRNIAEVVGIKTASIYYHYSNKEQILEDCYNFYIKHRYSTRLEREQYEQIIRHGTKKEILNVINYAYPDSIVENMILSLLTIFSRMYIDTKAKDIYADEVNRSMQYLIEFFNVGIEVGRFHEFNVPAVSLVLLSSRLFTAQSVTLQLELKDDWRKTELDVFDELLNIIPFKY